MDWVDLHGRHYGQYWLFKADRFHVDSQTVASTFTGVVSAAAATQPAGRRPELSLEEILNRAKPAVVCLTSPILSGSGFFRTDTGEIATNANNLGSQRKVVCSGRSCGSIPQDDFGTLVVNCDRPQTFTWRDNFMV